MNKVSRGMDIKKIMSIDNKLVHNRFVVKKKTRKHKNILLPVGQG